MNTVYRRNFDEPDEVIELERLTSKVLSLGGMSLALDTHQPGWHWKEHVRPVVGTDWCESRHIGYVVSGRVAIEMKDGTELEAQSGDAIDFPPGHDAWVIGDEPCVMVTWMGGTTWLAPLRTLKDGPGDTPVHRHRRLHRDRAAPRRSEVARPARRPQSANLGCHRSLPRPIDRVHW